MNPLCLVSDSHHPHGVGNQITEKCRGDRRKCIDNRIELLRVAINKTGVCVFRVFIDREIKRIENRDRHNRNSRPFEKSSKAFFFKYSPNSIPKAIVSLDTFFIL